MSKAVIANIEGYRSTYSFIQGMYSGAGVSKLREEPIWFFNSFIQHRAQLIWIHSSESNIVITDEHKRGASIIPEGIINRAQQVEGDFIYDVDSREVIYCSAWKMPQAGWYSFPYNLKVRETQIARGVLMLFPLIEGDQLYFTEVDSLYTPLLAGMFYNTTRKLHVKKGDPVTNAGINLLTEYIKYNYSLDSGDERNLREIATMHELREFTTSLPREEFQKFLDLENKEPLDNTHPVSLEGLIELGRIPLGDFELEILYPNIFLPYPDKEKPTHIQLTYAHVRVQEHEATLTVLFKIRHSQFVQQHKEMYERELELYFSEKGLTSVSCFSTLSYRDFDDGINYNEEDY